MAEWFDRLSDELQDFIRAQHMFFVATAPSDGGGYPNLSPKGYDSLAVLGEKELVFLDLPGSGNQTASHLAGGGRITLMFASFDSRALILRVYGRGRPVTPGAPGWDDAVAKVGADRISPRIRQLICIDVEHVQTSCGWAVPRYDFVEERATLNKYYDSKEEKGELEAVTEFCRQPQAPIE